LKNIFYVIAYGICGYIVGFYGTLLLFKLLGVN